MLLNRMLEPFLNQRPVCVMARGVIEHLLDPARIDALFRDSAERQYEKELLFSSLVELMSDIVLRIQPSVHAAYQSRRAELKISTTALYNKLDRVELGISAELVRDSARQAAALVDALDARRTPWLAGYACRVLDGNFLSATDHRIEELRTTWAAPLPGKLLVVLDPEYMLARDVFLTEDGHAQERSLLDAVIETIRAQDLWIGDRNFCTLKFLMEISRRLGCFIIRQHGCVKGELVGKRRRVTRTATGVVYEQTLILTDAQTGEKISVRRVTVELKTPTREGDWEIHLLTNLPVEAAEAAQVAELYRKRWTIETVFQQITATLRCEINTLGYPPAALFAFCLALLAYHAVSVLQASLRAVHGDQKVTEEVSTYYLALEIRQAYDGMAVAIPDQYWKPLRQKTAQQMASWLKAIARRLDLSRYRKHSRGPKKKPPKKSAYKNGGHLSTARILQGQPPC